MSVMTEDIQPEVLKRTQESLGKFIKKPVLSEKLLRKPPFRFLHDICTAAMKETGFFEGTLSGNDIKIELINDKEGKIAFLQKVIAAVESANNVKLAVKPNKIVAGHEPMKTNEFLQALADALQKQVETKSPNKKSNKPKTKPNKTEDKEDETVKRKNVANKPPPKKVETSEPVKPEVKRRRPGEKREEKTNVEVRRKAGEKEKVRKKTEKEKPEPAVEEEKPEPDVEKLEEPVGLTNGSKEPAADGEEGIEPFSKVLENGESGARIESARPPSAKLKRRTPSARPPTADVAPSEPPAPSVPATEALDRVLGGVVNDIDVPSAATISPPPPAATSSPAPPSASVLRSAVPREPLQATTPVASPAPTPDQKSGSEAVPTAVRPRTAIRPPSARPASARPAAPRIRDRGQVPLQEDVLKPAAGKVNLIVEQEVSQPDDEELVSVQVAQDVEDVGAEPLAHVELPVDGSEHGQLVAQILEAQKELVEDTFAKQGSQQHTEIEWNSGRGIESTRRDVERIRSGLQVLTRSANPLGKLLEFLQEDIDSMQQELTSWRERNYGLSAKLEQEKSLTDMSIEPLKIHLEELQQSINLETEQIGALKAVVLRNDEKINKVILGL